MLAMLKREIQSSNIFLKSLELAGKPIFFLFTVLVLGLAAYLHLLTIFVHRLSTHSKSFILTTRWLIGKLFNWFIGLSTSFSRFRLPVFSPSPLPRLRFSRFVTITSIFTFLLFCIGALFYWYILRDLPDPHLLSQNLPNLSTKLYDRHGKLLYKIYDSENRTLVTLANLPPHLLQATIAAEDKNFYHHRGLDLGGIIRAMRNNLVCYVESSRCNSSLQGGSTLTQQLVKNTLLTPEKTWERKLKEAVLALQVERLYTKAQILELYLNHIPYGGVSYGVEEASQDLFGKSANQLDLAESALIAGLPQAPTSLSPYGLSPYLGKVRQTQVLENMVKLGMIDENAKVAAEARPLTLHPREGSLLAPHFVMYVKSLLVKQYGEAVVERGGLEVVTTLDLDKQTLLEDSIRAELAKLERLSVSNGAGLIIAPQTGEILAMAGSRNFFDATTGGQVNVTLMPRQPGSSIKPLTYALALMSGLTPNTTIDDSPVCFRQIGSPDYCPDNYDGRFHGQVTLRTALASSYNIPAIKLLNSLGVNRLVEFGRSLGITTWQDSSRFGLSLTLGGGEVTMYDLAQVYSVFANGGRKIPLQAILSVTSPTGVSLLEDPPSLTVKAADNVGEQLIPESIAYQISSILADPAARAPAFGYRSVLNLPGRSVSVKTGTTNNLRDNWTIGYTPDYLVATWVGNNDNTPMSHVASGITGASPIWAQVMQSLVPEGDPLTPPPSTLLPVPLCSTTRAYYCDNLCDGVKVLEFFVPGTEPKPDCSNAGGVTP